PSASSGTVLLSNVSCRRRRSLDGPWRYIVDPYDLGYVDILTRRNRQGFYRDHKPRHRGDRVEYDFDRSGELQVPGDWNTQDPTLHYYEGTVWYRTIVEVAADDPAADSANRTFVHVGAANHTARVFLDGEELACHVGGYGPFAVEVTGRLDPGPHSLILQVNNRRESDRVPAMRSDWWNFGGLHRSVDLVTVPPVFLRDAWVTMDADGALVAGATVDAHTDTPAAVSVELIDLGLTIDLEPVVGTPGEFAARTDADVERWHPGRPVLHRVRWRCVSGAGDAAAVDTFDDEVGFRTVAVDGNRILVNGEPTFLRGISIHGEGPSGGRRASGPDDAGTLLDWAVDLGANFVRLAHYQHDEHMVREADRRGLLAWCELPVYWNIAWDDPRVLDNALAQADELVVRDRSRASVALWSVANETLPGEGRHEFLGALVDRVRRLDPTRLVSGALITLPTGGLDFSADDEFGSILDVVAINQYLGWYYGERHEIPLATFTTPWGKPILFSELGAGAKHGLHGDDDEIWTEEFQAAVYRAQLEMIRRQPDCAGLSPWILKDFRTPLRVLPDVQDGYNRKGLVSEEGERKLAFDVVADAYRDLA
ncbi:MAG: glycoside hydrolase family 2 TIM barrel-domain containing protein, partial [Actinomycetota bacterium]